MVASDALEEALDRLAGLAPEFGGFLANHGPMVAETLVHLGHGGDVADWVQRYHPRLEAAPPPTGSRVTPQAWRDALGERERFADWEAFFRSQIADDGWHRVLVVWWPRLLPGAAASAAHGLIRTAHAVRPLAAATSEEPALARELASGLAFWASAFQELPGQPTLSGRLGVAEALAHVPLLDADAPSVGPGISGRLGALQGLAGMNAALDDLGVTTDAARALDELIRAASALVITRDDAAIALCHAVTAPAAMQMVLPRLPGELHRPSVAASWQIVASIVAAFPPPPPSRNPPPTSTIPTRADVIERALEHGDEHVIKLTAALVDQFDRTDDAALLVAADRFRPRVRPFWNARDRVPREVGSPHPARALRVGGRSGTSASVMTVEPCAADVHGAGPPSPHHVPHSSGS